MKNVLEVFEYSVQSYPCIEMPVSVQKKNTKEDADNFDN